MIRLTAALPLTLLLTAAGGTPAEPIRGCMSHPALHGDRLVFESAGDLWMARLPADPAAPIEAARLTSGSGTESWPVFRRLQSLGRYRRTDFYGECDRNQAHRLGCVYGTL